MVRAPQRQWFRGRHLHCPLCVGPLPEYQIQTALRNVVPALFGMLCDFGPLKRCSQPTLCWTLTLPCLTVRGVTVVQASGRVDVPGEFLVVNQPVAPNCQLTHSKSTELMRLFVKTLNVFSSQLLCSSSFGRETFVLPGLKFLSLADITSDSHVRMCARLIVNAFPFTENETVNPVVWWVLAHGTLVLSVWCAALHAEWGCKRRKTSGSSTRATRLRTART